MNKIKTVLFLGMIIGACTFANNSFAGTYYEVPVRDDSLKPFARFELKDFRVQQKNGVTAVSYHLPKELVGEVRKLEFKSKPARRAQIADSVTRKIAGNQIDLEGPEGILNCDVDGEAKIQMCRAQYQMNISINPEKVALFINSMNVSDQEKLARLGVAESFRLDPEGVIYIGPYTGR